MPRAYGSRASMALAFESSYGVAPVSGFFQMPFVSSGLSDEQALIPDDLLGSGRDVLDPSRDAIAVGGGAVVPLDSDAIGYWLRALMGAPVTTGTTPRTHTFASGAATLPSMSIEIGMPEVPRFAMHRGVRANSLTIPMSRTGMQTASIEMIGQSVTAASTTQAGTPAAIAQQRFTSFQGTIQRDGSALANIASASLTYSNNMEAVETIRGDGLIEDVDPTRATLSGQLVARLADSTLLDQAVAGGPCTLLFRWLISANVSLSVTAHRVFLPVPRKEISGPGGIQCTFDWVAARATGSPNRLCTVALVNAVSSYA